MIDGALTGVDVSSWQHTADRPIDWSEVLHDGIDFAIIKATQGIDYVNPWLVEDLTEAKFAGLLVGVYHYAAPGNGTAIEQAEHFTSSLIGHALDLGVWLDFEDTGNLQQPEYQGWIQGFLTKTGEVRTNHGLYCNPAMLEELGAYYQVPRLWLADWSNVSERARYMTQYATNKWVKGINDPVDLNRLTSARGVNLPTAPKPRPKPTAADVKTIQESIAKATASPADTSSEGSTSEAVPKT